MERLYFGVKKLALAFGLALSVSMTAHATVEYCPAPSTVKVAWVYLGGNTYTTTITPPAGWHQVAAQWSTHDAELIFSGAYAWVVDPGTRFWSSLLSKSITCIYGSGISSNDTISIAKDNISMESYTLTNGDQTDRVNYWYYYNPSKHLAKCTPTVKNAYYNCGFTL